MKRIIELSIKGVGLALALFAVFGLVADVANQGVFTLKNYNYTKMVIGAVIVGLGFSVPGIVYETTDFSYAGKNSDPYGNGMCHLFDYGYAVGWFSLAGGIRQCMPPILASLEHQYCSGSYSCFGTGERQKGSMKGSGSSKMRMKFM